MAENFANQAMLQIGSYPFLINTAAHQTLKRNTNYTWPQIGRVGVLDALQYTGPGDDTITLPGVIYPAYLNVGTQQIAAMRAEAAKGSPLPLVDGRGIYYGVWVITDIEQEDSVLMRDGTPRKQTFTMKLKRFA